jgi:outer membrane protein assembly factor BamB
VVPRWVFPPLDEPPRGAFAASPVLSTTEASVYIGSTDGGLFAVNSADGSLSASLLTLNSPITSTALAVLRFGSDAIFVGGGDGFLYGLDALGNRQPDYWPFPVGSFVTGGPAMSANDGTVYVGAQNGSFYAVCPNGIGRFTYPLRTIQSSAGVGADGTIYFGANDGQLRAIVPTGPFGWAFSTGAPIVAAPLVDVNTDSVFVANTQGFLFKVTSAGQVDPGFSVFRAGPIRGSPALAGNTLYVPSGDGHLYAVDKSTGATLWSLATAGAINSSPAVALGPDDTTVVVVGSDDGYLYFIEDTGAVGELVRVCRLGADPECSAHQADANGGAPIRSSPAIGSDGTVYVGTDDGRLYALGAAAPS